MAAMNNRYRQVGGNAAQLTSAVVGTPGFGAVLLQLNKLVQTAMTHAGIASRGLKMVRP